MSAGSLLIALLTERVLDAPNQLEALHYVYTNYSPETFAAVTAATLKGTGTQND